MNRVTFEGLDYAPVADFEPAPRGVRRLDDSSPTTWVSTSA